MCRKDRPGIWAALLFLLLPLPAVGQQSDRSDRLASQLDLLNRELAATASVAADHRPLGELLATRASLLAELIAANPAKAVDLALSPETAAQLRRIAPDASIEIREEWEGTLEAIVADDFEHHRSSTGWYLQTPARRFEVYFAEPATRRPGVAVRVGGIQAGGRIAAARVTTLAASPAASTPQQCTTIGPQNIAVLMLTTPSNPTFPSGFTPASLGTVFFGIQSDGYNSESLSLLLQEMSYGQASATGQVFGPFALSQDYACDQYDILSVAAIQAADPTVDFTQFTRIALVYPASSCSWGDMSEIGCGSMSSPSKGDLIASMTWLPVTSDLLAPPLYSYVHELGHSLGLLDSNTDDYDRIPLGPLNTPGLDVEYGDLFSVMGYGSGQYPAPSKGLLLAWLNPGDYQEVRSPGSFTLVPFEAAAGLRALRVLRDATTDAWLWIEYRQPIGWMDINLQNIPGSNVFNGALVHYEDLSLDTLRTHLLTFNPVSAPNSFNNAALAAGHSWSDPFSLLTLSVGSATSSGLSVTVHYDQPCATLQFSTTPLNATGGSGDITISAPATCAWTAYTAADWITFAGAGSGQGNGVVHFSVSPNSANVQRTSSIAVQRQNIPVVQSGTGLLVLSVSPSSGTGNSGQFTFRFSDPIGYGDVSEVFLELDPLGRCLIVAQPSFNQITLDKSSFTLPSAGASVSNDFCAVYSDGSSITGSGNQLTVTVAVGFAPTLSGTHQIQAFGDTYQLGDSSAPIVLGTWTFPGASCTYKVSPTSQSFGATGGTGSVNVTAPAGCAWTAASFLPWLTVTGAASGSGNGIVSYSVAPNTTVYSRAGTLLIGGQGFQVTQARLATVVTNVTSALPNGTYGSIMNIGINLTLTNPVTVVGTPQLALNSGGTASYSSKRNTTTLTFSYKVAPGETSPRLDYTSANALTLNGGAIYDWADSPANLALPAPGTAGSLGANNNIVIDGVPPVVIAVSTTAAAGTYGIGAVIPINVTFSKKVIAGSGASLSLNSGGFALYSGGTGSDTIAFTYTVLVGQDCAKLDVTALYGGVTDTVYNPANPSLPAPGAAGSIGGGTTIVIDTAPPPPVLSPVSVSPASGNPGTQPLTFVYTIPGSGYLNLKVLDVLISNALDGRHACYVAVLPWGSSSGSVYLVDDAGDAGGPYQGLVVGTAHMGPDTMGNGQCTIQAAGSSVTNNGNNLTLTLSMTFSSSFAGNKIVYMSVQDTAGNNSGWQALGTLSVPGPAPIGPAVTGMSPGRSSTATQAYTFTFTDTNGWNDITVADILIANAMDGRQACYVAIVPASATSASIMLVDDGGDAAGPYSGMVVPGSGTVSNSQCSITGAGSSVNGSGNTLTVTLAMSFNHSFAGNRVFFLAARNNTLDTGWQAAGTVLVP